VTHIKVRDGVGDVDVPHQRKLPAYISHFEVSGSVPDKPVIQSKPSSHPNVQELPHVLELQRPPRKFAAWRKHHTPRPAESEPIHDHRQYREGPGTEALEVKNRALVERTKQRPQAEEASEARPQVHDIRIANPDPPICDNAGKRQLLQQIAVPSYDLKTELPGKRLHQALDAAEGAASLEGWKIIAEKHKNNGLILRLNTVWAVRQPLASVYSL
jgi:hypothetical protein